MKVLLTTLNAKYIHTSLALRLLYVANKDKADVDFKEYIIKENIELIAEDILSKEYDIVCLGVYIWNVSQTERLIKILKTRNPKIKIILGGPEVSYEPEFFLQHWEIDYIISGEGEFVLGELIRKIGEGEEYISLEGISSREVISKAVLKVDLEKLIQYPSPYQLPEDKESLSQRVVYIETSRGCPYECQYCLSSLEQGIRYFPMEYIMENLRYLIANGAKLIKFLDRTFNLNKKHTRALFDFLIEQYRPGLSVQFEIYADILDKEMIDYLNEKLPLHYFRFEIGIQSTHEPTNKAIKRKQNFVKLAENIRLLMEGGKVDLHLDLIAGLPFETFDLFKKSFNDIFAFGAKEVQLGFLKMLRGTQLRKDAEKYQYIFDNKAPYEISENESISLAELERIHEAEHALEKYWNKGRFSRTMKALFQTHYKGRYFELFDEIGQYYKQHQYPHYGYQLEDLFDILHAFLKSKNISLLNELRSDYYHNFNTRPAPLKAGRIEKKKRKQLAYQIGNDKDFLEKHNLTRKIIEKNAVIDYFSENELLLTIYLHVKNKVELKELKYRSISQSYTEYPPSFTESIFP